MFFRIHGSDRNSSGLVRVELEATLVGVKLTHSCNSATTIADSISGLGDVDLDDMHSERLAST